MFCVVYVLFGLFFGYCFLFQPFLVQVKGCNNFYQPLFWQMSNIFVATCYCFWGTFKQHMNYKNRETMTFGCCNPTSRCAKTITTVKRRVLHLATIERPILLSQQPPNYNNCEPTAVKWRLLQNFVTRDSTIKVHEILRRFMVVVVSNAIRKSLNFCCCSSFYKLSCFFCMACIFMDTKNPNLLKPILECFVVFQKKTFHHCKKNHLHQSGW